MIRVATRVSNLLGAILCWALAGLYWWRGLVGDPDGWRDWFFASFFLVLSYQFTRNDKRAQRDE